MCRSNQDLPVFPWETIGPPSRRGASRVGVFGEKVIVRSNPVGAIFDWLRGFCSPLPQQEVSEGEFVTDDEQYSTVSPTESYAPIYNVPSDVYTPNYPVAGSADPSTRCGAGTLWDSALGSCVPDRSPSLDVDPAGPSAAIAAREAFRRASTAKDCAGVRTVMDTAAVMRGKSGSAAWARWEPIRKLAADWLGSHKKLCKG